MDSYEEPEPQATESSSSASQSLYPGDNGTLSLEARRVLVQLLSGPSLDARRHTRLWPVLLAHEAEIRSRLADLFLELVLDAELQVAFVRQADTGELETPILLRRTPLTFLESALLLYLRELLAQADIRGERAVVSLDEMLEQMKLYERYLNTDRAGFENRARAAVEKVKKNSLLSAVRGSTDRFEIAPTLKLLFSAEEVAALAERFSAVRTEVDGTIATEQDDEDEA